MEKPIAYTSLWITTFMRRTCGFRMRQLPFMGILCIIMLVIVYRTTTNYQHQQTKLDSKIQPFETVNGFVTRSELLSGLPQGIIHSKSDLELKPLWSDGISRAKSHDYNSRNLLAVPVGIDQKENVDLMVRKFISENFTIILFHYDGNISGWWDLGWSTLATHVSAQWQTKWWFAKRFLHPDIVSVYDYIFLWDEDLGVENFNPGRYLDVMKSEGLEISQPALDPDSSEIHHRITIRKRTKKVHRRVYEARGSTKCFNTSLGPPCTGWVEGMAPVFSRSAWYCAWHLIQNDLVHGWGLDMKLGYCAQGDRTKKVGIIDSEYIVHHGIQTLGGTSKKGYGGGPSVDARVEIRRQSVWELQTFRERWNRAVHNDETWVDPYNPSN